MDLTYLFEILSCHHHFCRVIWVFLFGDIRVLVKTKDSLLCVTNHCMKVLRFFNTSITVLFSVSRFYSARKLCIYYISNLYVSQLKLVIKRIITYTPRHGCTPVNLLHIFWTPSTKNNSGRLLLSILDVWLSWFWIRLWLSGGFLYYCQLRLLLWIFLLQCKRQAFLIEWQTIQMWMF